MEERRSDYLLERGGRGGLVELGLPFAEHLVNLLLKHRRIDAAALLPGELKVREHRLEIVHAVLRLVLERPVAHRLAFPLRISLLHPHLIEFDGS